MKLNELFDIITNPDRIRIIKDGKDVFVGYLGILKHHGETILTGQEEIEKLRVVPEISHKRWRELGLRTPLQPDETPMYSFSDLEMKLYYTIFLK